MIHKLNKENNGFCTVLKLNMKINRYYAFEEICILGILVYKKNICISSIISFHQEGVVFCNCAVSSPLYRNVAAEKKNV